MIELGQQHGLSLTQCLDGVGIDPVGLKNSETLVTAAQELQVIENLVRGLPHVKGLGLQAGMRYQLTTFGIWAFAIISSPTVRDAIDVGLKFTDLSFVLLDFSFNETPESAEIEMRVDHIPPHLRQFVVERHLAIFMLLTREMMGPEALAPKEIVLTLDAPVSATSGPDKPKTETSPFSVLGALLPDTRIQYGASTNRFVLDKALLARPIPKANPATAAFCVQQCEALLNQRRAQTGFSGQVRHFLLEHLSAMPTLQEAAAHFHLSPRTFGRRLEDEGSSFRSLAEEVREGVAIELLATARLSVDSVAERLGYAEAASFIRAFKRWTGKTPAQFRRAEQD